MQPQPGIFALGTLEHSYVEFDVAPRGSFAELVVALAALSGPQTTVSGLNVVLGFRPELWGELTGTAPAAASFTGPVRGNGLEMPATQHDAWLWISGGSRDAVFDATIGVLGAVSPNAVPATEINGWLYRHKRDLTGFVDGTENPTMLEAQGVAAAEDGSSVLLYQLWEHHPRWQGLPVPQQERIIGRTKPDSVELAEDVMPPDSHVSRTVVEEDGVELAIYRRNTAYGAATRHGTVFVGFCAQQRVLATMLDRMAGVGDGIRDALTFYTTPLSGAYYLVPSVEALAAFVPDED